MVEKWIPAFAGMTNVSGKAFGAGMAYPPA